MKPLACAALSLFAALAAGCVLQPCTIGSVVEGSAMVKLDAEGVWKEAESDSMLYAGDFVRTDEGMRLHFRLDGNEVVMDERTSLFLTARTDDGHRRLCLDRGDLFLSVGQGRTPVRIETAAGDILLHEGLLFLRVAERQGELFARHAVDGSREMQLNAALLSGRAVVESIGRARRLGPGQLCYAETGSPPSEPVNADPQVLEETRRWLRRQFASRGMEASGFPGSRKSLYVPEADGAGKKPSPAGDGGGAAGPEKAAPGGDGASGKGDSK